MNICCGLTEFVSGVALKVAVGFTSTTFCDVKWSVKSVLVWMW